MKPYKSSSDKENCSPISSNCVVWQGPNISCINLCKGDSVSDIVYKLATEVCELQSSANLTDLELDCILDLCSKSPTPQLTLAAVLQLVINKVCCTYEQLNTAVNNLAASTGGSTTSSVSTARIGGSSEIILDLPGCLQYVDPFTNLLVTTLPLDEYVLTIASNFCQLKAIVDTHTTEISNLDSRVTVLENAPCCYQAPVVQSSCAYGDVVTGTPLQMDFLLQSLNTEFCGLRSVIGSNSQVISATASQCQNLSSLTALSQSGSMSTIPGWNITPANFAQSMQNLWLTVCDMRAVINDLKNCCGSNKCSSFLLGFTVGSVDTSNITLLFNSLTTIPSGYTDCPTQSSVTISDGDGNYFTQSFNLIADAMGSGGITFDIASSAFNEYLPWTITVTGCIQNEAGVCSKTITNTYAAITPTTTTTAAPCTTYSVLASGTELSAATGNTNTLNDGTIYVSYYICDSSTITTASFTDTSTHSICVKPGFIPFLFYFASDVLTPCTLSTATNLGTTCTP
jgi:hypothetical protein